MHGYVAMSDLLMVFVPVLCRLQEVGVNLTSTELEPLRKAADQAERAALASEAMARALKGT
eukprot:SAG31_NODE_1858_length_7061_cov_60.221201_2_plen_61_part_00